MTFRVNMLARRLADQYHMTASYLQKPEIAASTGMEIPGSFCLLPGRLKVTLGEGRSGYEPSLRNNNKLPSRTVIVVLTGTHNEPICCDLLGREPGCSACVPCLLPVLEPSTPAAGCQPHVYLAYRYESYRPLRALLRYSVH